MSVSVSPQAPPSSTGSKLIFLGGEGGRRGESVIHTSALPKKCSRTIQNPLNKTRMLAAAVRPLLSIRTAGGRKKKMFTLQLREKQSAWASEDTLRLLREKGETCECVSSTESVHGQPSTRWTAVCLSRLEWHSRRNHDGLHCTWMAENSLPDGGRSLVPLRVSLPPCQFRFKQTIPNGSVSHLGSCHFSKAH